MKPHQKYLSQKTLEGCTGFPSNPLYVTSSKASLTSSIFTSKLPGIALTVFIFLIVFIIQLALIICLVFLFNYHMYSSYTN